MIAKNNNKRNGLNDLKDLNDFVYDLIVVGGGPTGSVAARYAKLNGVSRVLVIEENASIGSPVQCAGLLSTAALLEPDMEPDSSFVLNAVKGAKVYPPSGKQLKIVGKETKAYVVSRKMFDRRLAEMAANEGADYLMKAQVVGLTDGVFADDSGDMKVKALEVIHNGEIQTYYAKVVIAADGVRSRTAGFAGLAPCEKVLSGVQIEANYLSEDSDFVEMFVGSAAPGFFAWSIPASETISRIGLAVDSDMKKAELKRAGLTEQIEPVSAGDYLNTLLQNPVIDAKITPGYSDFVVGGIPIGPMKKTYAAGLMIAGDAAGQCKPVSGGGIYTGAVAAKIAAKVAAEAIEEGDFSERKMSEYEKRWKKELGRELEIGMRIHDYRMKLSDEEMNKIFDGLNDPEILDLITEYGDMDHPSVLIQKLMLSKHSLKMAKLFGTFLKTLF
ncbi:NAD(P)/FAD-dependent oxidoreductase [Methanimicrococcus hacksteinii]|uniref:NAD(P)/FAD-dependent oxidoreductase n=1 Tax=Methanimicrococcus hacksteinii TaxID=3028293 RepID=UPI00298EFDE1|nr:NAD(P)/FAD-dependent oxidoreductase [Methanimicrococcus sp. At1]